MKYSVRTSLNNNKQIKIYCIFNIQWAKNKSKPKISKLSFPRILPLKTPSSLQTPLLKFTPCSHSMPIQDKEELMSRTSSWLPAPLDLIRITKSSSEFFKKLLITLVMLWTSKSSSKHSLPELYFFILFQGNPFSEEGRGANFSLYDLQGRGELTIEELKYVNNQFKYGYNDEQLWEVIHAVGGFNAETITFEKFSKYIQKKVAARKLAFWFF